MVADMSDEEIWRLQRGGHDPTEDLRGLRRGREARTGQPTVILAKTVKGYGLGKAGESINIAHQLKKPGVEAAARLPRPLPHPDPRRGARRGPVLQAGPENSAEMQYLRERREALGGSTRNGRTPGRAPRDPGPRPRSSRARLEGTGEPRDLHHHGLRAPAHGAHARQAAIGPRVVPIVADEARTFGMEGLFRTLGIYAAKGQLYDPVDADQVMYYREDAKGQILQEGITEAGAFSSWIAAATSYTNVHGCR